MTTSLSRPGVDRLCSLWMHRPVSVGLAPMPPPHQPVALPQFWQRGLVVDVITPDPGVGYRQPRAELLRLGRRAVCKQALVCSCELAYTGLTHPMNLAAQPWPRRRLGGYPTVVMVARGQRNNAKNRIWYPCYALDHDFRRKKRNSPPLPHRLSSPIIYVVGI